MQKEGLDILFKEGQILEVKYQNTLAKEVDVKVQPYGYISVSVEKEMPVFVNGVTSEYGEIKQVGYTRIKQRNEEVEIYAKEDIYDVWGNLVYAKDYCIQKILTNEDFVQSEALLKGEYYAKWQDRIVDFSIEEGEDIPNLSILFFKERNKGSITLQKTFEKGSREDLSYAYKDIVYGIYSEEAIYDSNSNILIDKDTLVYVSKIDANGYLVETMDLPIGKYYLKELATHALYEIDANTYRFEITEDTTSPIKINETGIIESKLKRMNLTIYNTNEKVNTSLYARFVLYDEDMNEITSFEVDKNGKYVVEDLVEGIYYLQEVEVEKGYKLNGTIQSINTSENRNIHIKNVETTPTNVVSTKDASQHQKWEVTMLLSMLVFYNAFKRSMKY